MLSNQLLRNELLCLFDSLLFDHQLLSDGAKGRLRILDIITEDPFGNLGTY